MLGEIEDKEPISKLLAQGKYEDNQIKKEFKIHKDVPERMPILW